MAKTKDTTGDEKLQITLDSIVSKFGKGTIGRLSDAPIQIERISSGSMALDRAMGGGYPKGRLIELYGEESVGKSTIALHAIAETQKAGGTAAIVDAEHALDPEYAEALDVRTDDLLLSQPDTGEDALEIVDMLVSSGEVDLVVIDSVAALVPKAELEGEMSDQQVGLQARLMSKAMRKLVGKARQTGTTLLFINQLRANIKTFGFGPTKNASGGNALKYATSVRLQIIRMGAEKQGEDVVGNKTQVKVVKNKTAPPFKVANFNIKFGVGIDKVKEVLDEAVSSKLIKKGGSWYTYGEHKWQGMESAREAFKLNPELFKEIEDKVTNPIADVIDIEANG